MKRLYRSVSILLSIVLISGMLTIIPGNSAFAAESSQAEVADADRYIYDSQSKELWLLQGDFSSADKWGSDVDENYVKSVVAEKGVTFSGDCTGLFKEFYRCETMDFSKADTSAVTNMELMFRHCESLQTLDLSGFDIGNVTDENGLLHWFF